MTTPIDSAHGVNPLYGVDGAHADLNKMMARARAAQPAWEAMGVRARARICGRVKTEMWRDLDATIAALKADVGKPRQEAVSECLASIEQWAYYQRVAAQVLAPYGALVAFVPHRKQWVERRPYGVVLVITPYNFPLVLSVAPIAAALAAGNTVIYKPSELAPHTTDAIAQAIYRAGVPRDVFQVVQGGREVGAALIEARPDRICFTGSVAAGRKIAARAGELLIPVTLELGAKDAAVVLDDADQDWAAHAIAAGGMYCAGQACLSIERLYVQRTIAPGFVSRMEEILRQQARVGSADDPSNTVIALRTEGQVSIVESHVNEAVAAGAKVIVGGKRNGRFFQPTLITDVTPEMRLMREETFGPVIAIVPFDHDEDAVKLVNASPFGLTASVWTRNQERGVRIARALKVGHAAVNDWLVSMSMPNIPWGGARDSGYGSTRGREGLLEMTRPQSISVARFLPRLSQFFLWPFTPLKYRVLHTFVRFIFAPGLLRKLYELARGFSRKLD